jgi:hypothetical protein
MRKQYAVGQARPSGKDRSYALLTILRAWVDRRGLPHISRRNFVPIFEVAFYQTLAISWFLCGLPTLLERGLYGYLSSALHAA